MWKLICNCWKVIRTVCIALVFVAVTTTVRGSVQASSDNPLRFIPVQPCRITDTRGANGAFGGPILAGGNTRVFPIPNSACGIPATARAYSMNLTVVPESSLGFVTLWPTGQTQPLVSTLNSVDGRIKSNAVILSAGENGGISVFSTDTTHVILDINGYFVTASEPTALAFYPITPCRVADTRNIPGPLGGPSLLAGETRTFPVLASACGPFYPLSPPSNAQAYSVNITVIPKEPLGFLTTWPSGQPRPTVSTLNALTGAITANAAIVPAGAGGGIDVFVTNLTDVIIDINGYFAPPTSVGLSLYDLAPCRVEDTRLSPGTPFIGPLDINVVGSPCAVPSTARAFVMNATVVPSGVLTFLTLWPQGATRPLVSTLNALEGFITSNMAIVPTTNGSISAFATEPTHLILDIAGYFAP